MKAIDLIEILSLMPPETEVVMNTEFYSIQPIGRVELGVFKTTDYGNDFLAHEDMLVGRTETKAIRLIPKEMEEENGTDDDRGAGTNPIS